MPEYSPRGYELPLGTDPIASGDNAMHANWTQADAELTVIDEHRVSLPRAMAVGNKFAGVTSTPVAYPITFPEGRFVSAPYVFCQCYENQWMDASPTNVTKDGFTLNITKNNGAPGDVIIRMWWLAVLF